MEEVYKNSLMLIKLNKIRTEKEYLKLSKKYFILSSVTLKILCNTRDFQDVIRYARKIEA